MSIKKIGTFIASRALYFVLGVLIAIGGTYVYATWDQARTLNNADPTELTQANWNWMVQMIEDEVANKWKLNGADVYYNAGDVGIGDTSPDSDLKLDVEGKVGATEYCDEDGNNCTAAANLDNGSCRRVSVPFPNTGVTGAISCNADEYVTGGGGYCGGCPIFLSRPADIHKWDLYCLAGCGGGGGLYSVTAICCKF